ncbi:conserved hypothetical protein [Leishmania infantum JPCM5]|uniref:Generative_cell_specific_1_protein_-_putative n=2 Tax=Leishmania infantum TaxID=5671 RepID=A0A6L0XUT0_LEIIN|nr:conserved hypothetical protein [Leishmania infantum JPCM5]CAC9542898.1 Generative_cell_specific_1_protein_-_putative [Leishmania infantum]CAM71954.1 conserved hypothetical protein [Leishmania infantum JPCM5]SUZ45877.1 Generative_cell_specific_1_protein_-_putative [Leishmania infantum]|eukprot:XP_001468864.1 conserved hypothetical protein [Leishmania infantum JPCM5]
MPRAYVVTRHPAATENAMPHHRARSSEGGKSGVLPSSRVSLLAILCGYLALTAALVASEPARKSGLVVLLVWVYRMTRETMRAYLAPQSRCSLCRSPKPRRHALAQVTVCIAVLCVSLLVRLACPARAAFVSSSLISYCSDSGDENISCTKKMVVTVTVEGEQLPGEESLLFLNSATDMTVNNGTAVQFSPLRITTSRSAVRYRYPLFYVQNYNAKPYEATVKGSLLNQCNADFNADTATCGLAYDAAGKAIPYSQGFCCDCSMCQTLGLCQPDARANAACNIFDKYTTASCLRFAQRWYSGYTIGGYMTWYTVNLTLSRNVSGSGGAGAAEKVVMHLSPSNNGETAGEGWDVMARIVGTYAPVDQPLDLTSRMLFAPAIPPNDARVQAGAAEWLLLPTNLVTLDGRECDKVGVSYEAFASQGNKCNLRPGSCLSSQLEDYRTADLQRIAAGNKGQYMATSFGDFNLENDAATSPYISYLAASPAATMISITVSADDLEYTVGLASGKIVSADLNKPTLQAGTADGVMTVMVRNTAAVTGRLVVGMLNCSDGVFPMTAQKLSLAAQQQAAVTFKVYVQNSYASGKASCTVVVRNAHEAITDLRVVSWKVSSTNFHNGTQGGSADDGSGGVSTEESSAASCLNCRTLDIACAVRRRCWQLILLDLFVYLLIIAVVLCVIFFWRVFCCCLYLLGRQHRRGSGGEAEPKNEASRWGGCWKRRGESGGTSSSRHTDHKNSGSSDAPLQAAAPVSPAPPSAPAMMYVPTPICYEPAPFTTRSGGVEAASSAASFTPPLQALPPPPAVLHPLALMPPPRWCPYGNEEAVVPGEGPCAAHAFPPHSPIGSFAFAAPPACPALRYGEEWNRCGSATSMSPLTPSRSTQEGSPYNEEARCTPRAFQRSWASTPRPPQSPGANAPYL